MSVSSPGEERPGPADDRVAGQVSEVESQAGLTAGGSHSHLLLRPEGASDQPTLHNYGVGVRGNLAGEQTSNII